MPVMPIPKAVNRDELESSSMTQMAKVGPRNQFCGGIELPGGSLP